MQYLFYIYYTKLFLLYFAIVYLTNKIRDSKKYTVTRFFVNNYVVHIIK